MKINIIQLSLQQLLHYGIHIGSHRRQLHRDLKAYLLGFKNGINIFNPQFMHMQLRLLSHIIINVLSRRQKILIVNQESTAATLTKINPKRLFLIDGKWLGGFLTNHKRIRLTQTKKTKNKTLAYFSVFPAMVIFLNSNSENWGFKECKHLNLPAAIVTGNSFSLLNKSLYPLVGNNLAHDALNLYVHLIRHAVIKGLLKERFNVISLNRRKWVNI